MIRNYKYNHSQEARTLTHKRTFKGTFYDLIKIILRKNIELFQTQNACTAAPRESQIQSRDLVGGGALRAAILLTDLVTGATSKLI